MTQTLHRLDGDIQSSWQNAPHFTHDTIAFRLHAQSLLARSGCLCWRPTLAGRPTLPPETGGTLLFPGGAEDDRRRPFCTSMYWPRLLLALVFSVAWGETNDGLGRVIDFRYGMKWHNRLPFKLIKVRLHYNRPKSKSKNRSNVMVK